MLICKSNTVFSNEPPREGHISFSVFLFFFLTIKNLSQSPFMWLTFCRYFVFIIIIELFIIEPKLLTIEILTSIKLSAHKDLRRT